MTCFGFVPWIRELDFLVLVSICIVCSIVLVARRDVKACLLASSASELVIERVCDRSEQVLGLNPFDEQTLASVRACARQTRTVCQTRETRRSPRSLNRDASSRSLPSIFLTADLISSTRSCAWTLSAAALS